MADKSLNCAENIRGCGKNDEYIFSKSPKMMVENDLEWRFWAERWAAETGKGEYLNLLKRKDAAIGEYRQKATGLPLMKKG